MNWFLNDIPVKETEYHCNPMSTGNVRKLQLIKCPASLNGVKVNAEAGSVSSSAELHIEGILFIIFGYIQNRFERGKCRYILMLLHNRAFYLT